MFTQIFPYHSIRKNRYFLITTSPSPVMAKFKHAFLSFLFLLASFYVSAQQEASQRVIAVEGRLVEQIRGSLTRVPNVTINLIGRSAVQTDGEGAFTFGVPLTSINRNDSKVNVKIQVPGYRIISPFDGIVEVDVGLAKTEADIIVVPKKGGSDIGGQSQKEVDDLDKKLRDLRKKHKLSLARLNAINSSLLEEIRKGDRERAKLQSEINEKERAIDNLGSANDEMRAEIAELRRNLAEKDKVIEEKNNEIYLLQEEKYLAQHNLYKSVAADLNDYLIRTKDAHEMLEDLGKYITTNYDPKKMALYNEALNTYNDIFGKINQNHSGSIEEVGHRWESESVGGQVGETYAILFDQLHYPKFEPLFDKVGSLIMDRRRGKAIKVAHQAFHEMYPVILNLEKSIDESLRVMEESL